MKRYDGETRTTHTCARVKLVLGLDAANAERPYPKLR
jgi:hypothetical protein